MKFVKKLAGYRVTKLSIPEGAKSTALLEHWVRAPTTPQRVVLRSRIVLSALEGHSADETASQVAVSPATVRLWTDRFEHGGPEALLHGLPVSIRRAARYLGVSATAVWRALRKNRSSA